MDVIYVGQSIDLNWSIKRNASEVLEDFSRADLKVFLTGNDFDGNYDGKYYFANHIDEQGRVVLDIDAGSLTPGTYCIEGIWIKNSHELLNSGWTRSISRARKDRIFKVSDVESECTDYDEEAGHVVAESHEINIATGTTSYGYDGMSAYETAIFNGSTAKTEKEWIDTYEKAEDRVNYEMDESHDGSVPGEPQSWANAELKRKQAEGQLGSSDPYYSTSRKKKEEDRQTAESNRASAETSRGTAETQRQKNEGQLGDTDPDYATSRIKKENDRQTAESGRASAESGRVSAENTRVQNEGSGGPSSAGYANSRIKKELDRQSAEGSVVLPESEEDHPMPTSGSGRLYNEAVRQHNEDVRQSQESTRQSTFETNEGSAASSEAGDGSRWGSYKSAEASRGTAYAAAEGTSSASAGDSNRWGAYKTAEASRNTAGETAEGTSSSTAGDGSRWGAYKTAEASRGTSYGTAEGSSSSEAGDGSRWGAYKTAEAARDSSFASAETTRNAGMAPLVGIFGCSTAAATAQKEVTASNYVLTNGGAFKVKFTYANSASSPTLKINSETAKAIVFNGAAADATNTWGAGEVVEFYYDPTYNSNAGGFIGRSTVVSVSQNTETGHTDINIGGNSFPVASTSEVQELREEISDLSLGKFYGFFEDDSDLPIGDLDGYAYVGASMPFAIYVFKNGEWSDSGTTYTPPVGNGEDIDTNDNNQLQFADRAYNSQNPNGMGYVILRKDKTFAEQIADKPNTIFEIRYDFDFNNSETPIEIPANCVLLFKGGSLRNGHIVFNSTKIVAENVTAFLGCTFEGSIKNKYLFVETFGVLPSNADNAPLINNLIELCYAVPHSLVFGQGTYKISSPLDCWFGYENKCEMYGTFRRTVILQETDNVPIVICHEYIHLHDIELRYANDQTDNVKATAIAFSRLTMAEIHSVWVRNCYNVLAIVHPEFTTHFVNDPSLVNSNIYDITVTHFSGYFLDFSKPEGVEHSIVSSGCSINNIYCNISHWDDEERNTCRGFLLLSSNTKMTIGNCNLEGGKVSNVLIEPSYNTYISIQHFHIEGVEFINASIIEVKSGSFIDIGCLDFDYRIKFATQYARLFTISGGVIRVGDLKFLPSPNGPDINTELFIASADYGTSGLAIIDAIAAQPSAATLQHNTQSTYARVFLRGKLAASDYGASNQRPSFYNINNGFMFYDTSVIPPRPLWKNESNQWVDVNGYKPLRKIGTTADRPTMQDDDSLVGFSYYDKTLNKPIYWTRVETLLTTVQTSNGEWNGNNNLTVGSLYKIYTTQGQGLKFAYKNSSYQEKEPTPFTTELEFTAKDYPYLYIVSNTTTGTFAFYKVEYKWVDATGTAV